VKDLQPNQFVLENVLEMESIAEEVIQDFNDINYTIQIKKVHGNDIGMKQNRKRIFFIGSKNN
jgi:DNA (cytosine-5)-methyltransferase 1